jgi:hypothetical protein
MTQASQEKFQKFSEKMKNLKFFFKTLRRSMQNRKVAYFNQDFCIYCTLQEAKMEEVLIPLGFLAAIVLIVYFVVSHRHRERMEFFGQGIGPFCIPAPSSLMGSKSLCCGLIFIALGLAGVILFIINGNMEDIEAVCFIVTVFLLGGAMLLYHRLTAGMREWGRRLYEKKVDTISRKS